MSRDAGTGLSRSAQRWLELARGLLEQPTAPCKEDLPRAHIRAFAQARPALSCSEDAAGNVLVKYAGGRRRLTPPLVLVAHLDHPGFWIAGATAKQAVLAFKGGVGARHARRGQRVCFFEMGKAQPTGRGELTSVTATRGRLAGAKARVIEGAAAPGGFAMWDFPPFALRDGLIVSRSCDDTLGSSAALCVLDELARRKPRAANVWGLFTRAEEIGFLGALEAIRLKGLPRDACILSLECSKAAGIAPQGDGVVVRVGDKSSVFDPQLTEALRRAAEEVRRGDRGFKYQRKLMDGGSCEASAFCAYGYRASGLAVPLGNYHNQLDEPDGPGIGPETVRAGDFACEIKLLVALAERPHLLQWRPGKVAGWLQERAKAARRELSRRGPPPDAGRRKKWID